MKKILFLLFSVFLLTDLVQALEPIEFYSEIKAVESAKLLSLGDWDTEGGSVSTATELIEDYYGVSGNFFQFKRRSGVSPLTSYNVQGFSVYHLFENLQLPTNQNEKLTFTYYTNDVSLTPGNENFYMWITSSFDAMYENYDTLNGLLHGSYDQYYYGDDYTVKFASVSCDLVTSVTTTQDIYKCTSTVEFDLNKFKPSSDPLDVYDYLFFGYTSNSNFGPGSIAFVNNLNYERVEITPTPTPTPTPPDVSDVITDETPPDISGLGDSAGWLPAGPLDSILNLPLTMFQNLNNALSNQCTPVIVNLPYVDKPITLPCISDIFSQIDGLSVWWNSIGVLLGGYILLKYLIGLEKWADATLTFRENHWNDWGGV